jgi:hypothetical protein
LSRTPPDYLSNTRLRAVDKTIPCAPQALRNQLKGIREEYGKRRQPFTDDPDCQSLWAWTRKTAFFGTCCVTNLSRDGAMLENVKSAIKLGDLVTLRCEGTTRRFRVSGTSCRVKNGGLDRAALGGPKHRGHLLSAVF